ncbi:MAG: response regulator transcription factor [Kiritimatiellae bacterium]|nr:response regulator transcription factor [Kiritimatiellia bacterium]
MRQLKCIIVDDERLARASLRALLEAHPELEIVAEASSVNEALEAISKYQPELVFLDIQMPGGTGFDLLKKLDNPPTIIFVTAYDKYAVRAFEVNALDYLLKPVEQERLRGCLEKLLSAPQLRCCHSAAADSPLRFDDEVLLDSGTRCILVAVADILAVRADGNYTRVIMNDGEEIFVRVSLTRWIKRLPTVNFKQLTRSLLLNFDAVHEWCPEGRELQLRFRDSSYVLQLSRVAAERFKKIVNS